MTQIIPTAEPFFFPGQAGKPGCLLVHGFTGAPKEMRWMGEYLNREHGCHCLGVRLAGHATRPDDMVRSRYTDWTASVEDGYHLLCDALSLSKGGIADRIYLVGLSMGGILCLLMSTRLVVKGVVAMSTPYRLPRDYPAWAIQAFSRVVKYQNKSKERPGESWYDKDAYAEHVSYPQNPVRSAAELQKLTAVMRAALPKVKVPVLLMHSRNDRYVLPKNMERIYADLGASDKTMLWVTESGHVIPRDAERNTAFAAAANFIHRIEQEKSIEP